LALADDDHSKTPLQIETLTHFKLEILRGLGYFIPQRR
jgi:hypothetical protein